MACRFGKVVPNVLRRLVEQCWHEDLRKRPEFPVLTQQMNDIWSSIPKEPNSVANENSRSSPKLKACCFC